MSPTAHDYEAAFARECCFEYPYMEIWEEEVGYAIDRGRLEMMARVCACPIKRNPPNWQHGRAVYALARKRIETLPAPQPSRLHTFLDVGTAKGFSALCLLWAIHDANRPDISVVTVDVIDPGSTAPRNSIRDLDGPCDLMGYMGPFMPQLDGMMMAALCSTGVDFLQQMVERREPIPFAFVDGKHSEDQVAIEARLLSQVQERGDMILFDDLQMIPVRRAVGRVEALGYRLELIKPCKERTYGWATKL